MQKIFVAEVVRLAGNTWMSWDPLGYFTSVEQFKEEIQVLNENCFICECHTPGVYQISTFRGIVYVRVTEVELNKVVGPIPPALRNY